MHLLQVHTQTASAVVISSLSPRELINKDESAVKKLKVMMLGVKSEPNANGVTEELPTMGTMTLHRLREPDTQPKELSEGNLST